MSRRPLCVLVAVASFLLPTLGTSVSAVEPGERTITFEEILDGSVRFRPALPRARFDASGRAVRVGNEEWASVEDGGPTTPTGSDEAGRPVDAGLRAAIAAARPDDDVDDWMRVRRKLYSDEGDAVLIARDEGLLVRRAGGAARYIAFDGPHEILTLAPDGRHASWVANGDLIVLETESGRRTTITTPPGDASDGGPREYLHGKLDWVYQEELYGRGNFRGHWWSPDGKHLIFLRLDDTEVPEFRIIDHVPNRQESLTMRYPKAGDPNPRVAVGIHSVERGTVVWADLSEVERETDGELLVVRVGWTPSGDRAVIQVQDRVQSQLDLDLVDPSSGAVTRLLRETSDSWVNILGTPRWLDDGSFLWFSERTGFKHVYRYTVDGDLLATPTVGDWQVRSLLRVDEDRREIWFSASIPSAVESHAYRVSFDGGVLTQLTRDPGSHSLTIAPDGESFIDQWSSHRDPGALRLCDRDGRILRVLATATVPSIEEYAYSTPERLAIPTRDGRSLEAMLFRPADFDESVPHPVWLTTYSGPDSPTVRDSWQSDAWSQFLTQQGFLVLEVNNRSSSGRGQEDTAVCHRRLGVSELRDLEDAVDWLTAHPWADAARVGITGWSYGGFMSAFALTHSDKFALGIAGAGVYDWRLYDTIYTERYMDTPAMNEEGYSGTSVIGAADDLQGHLLIVHGMDDDNVHVQNAMQLARALQRAGKDFELMVYPSARHGIRDPRQRRHLKTLEWRTMREHLLGERVDPGISGTPSDDEGARR